MTIDDILNILVDNDGAMIVRPASTDDLAQCQKDMAEMGFAVVPQEYLDFLSKLNGFAWNGIEFFSTDQVTDLETGYMLGDIVSANETFADCNEGCEHCVQLGRADEDLFVYNTENSRFEVLDMSGRDVMEEHESFESLFVSVVSPRM